MSAHKKKSGASTVSRVVVGSGRKHHRLNFRIRVVGLIAGVVLVLGCLIAATWLIMHNRDNNVSSRSHKAIIKSPWTPSNKADYLSQNGQYAAAQQVLETELSQTSDKQVKQGIYIQQAATALNAKQYIDALKYAKQADTILPTSGTANVLGQIAQQMNDKVSARMYYQQAIDRLDKTSHTYTRDLNEYQTELGAV